MRVALTVAALSTLIVAGLGAQSTSAPNAYVRLTAHDSSGAPVAGAEVTVRSGLKDVVATGTTDDEGRALLTMQAKDSTDFSLTMRKIGYVRSDRFFATSPRDTAVVTLVIPRPASNALAPVKVTADRDTKSKLYSYDLYADDIENASGWMDNGWEVIKKLRPGMLTSKGGCATGAREVWVNGKRIRLPLPPTGLAAARARVGVPPGARFSYVPVSVLSEIAPEHIAEIHYHDCFDHSMAAVGNNDAIFVTLKPGVYYEENVGSFVISADDEAKIAAKKK